MKKILLLAATILSVALFASCTGGNNTGGNITVNPGTVNFTATGGTEYVTVTGSDWTVTSNNPGWITAVKEGNSVKVTVGAATEARAGSVTVASSTDSKVVNVVQAAPTATANTLYELDNSDIDALVAHFNANLTTIDVDGDGQIWRVANFQSGATGIMSASWDNNTALTPDNWLLLPGKQIVSGGKFTMTITAPDPDGYHKEYFEVRILDQPIASGNYSTTELLFSYRLTYGDFQPYYVDVDIPAKYNGKTAYIAIRHCDTTDEYYIVVQAMKLTHNGPAGAPMLAPETGKNTLDYTDYLFKSSRR